MSKDTISPEKYNKYSHIITRVYYDLYNNAEEKKRNSFSEEALVIRWSNISLGYLLKGLRQSFYQPDIFLQIVFLSLSSDRAHEYLPIKEKIEYAFQARKNLDKFTTVVEDDPIIGSSYHQIGMVYQGQRLWKEALDNYSAAIEWKEKTQQHHALGSSYHQIGMVYEEQRLWKEGSAHYIMSLQYYLQYDDNSPDIQVVLTSMVRLHGEIEKNGKEIPADLHQIIEKIKKENT